MKSFITLLNEYDSEVDIKVYLDLKRAIGMVTDNVAVGKALFNYFVKACANKNRERHGKWIRIEGNYLVMDHHCPHYVLVSAEKYNETPEPAYEYFIEMFTDIFLKNEYAYIGKTNMQNANRQQLSNRIRKGKFNVRPYIQEILDLLTDWSDLELEWEPERDLEELADEWRKEDDDMDATYRDLYYFR